MTSRPATIVAIICVAILAYRVPSAIAQGRNVSSVPPFSIEDVRKQARDLAKTPFAPQQLQVAERWASIDYDKHRDIRFRREKAIWHDEGKNFELHLLPGGWLFKFPVQINIVDDGVVRA